MRCAVKTPPYCLQVTNLRSCAGNATSAGDDDCSVFNLENKSLGIWNRKIMFVIQLQVMLTIEKVVILFIYLIVQAI